MWSSSIFHLLLFFQLLHNFLFQLNRKSGEKSIFNQNLYSLHSTDVLIELLINVSVFGKRLNKCRNVWLREFRSKKYFVQYFTKIDVIFIELLILTQYNHNLCKTINLKQIRASLSIKSLLELRTALGYFQYLKKNLYSLSNTKRIFFNYFLSFYIWTKWKIKILEYKNEWNWYIIL